MIRVLYLLFGLLWAVGLPAQAYQNIHAAAVALTGHPLTSVQAAGGGAFVRTLSDPNGNVEVFTMTPNAAATGFVFAGAREDVAMIGEFTTDGTVLWTRALNLATDDVAHITELIVDSDGMIAGAGFTGDFFTGQTGLLFRYDPVSGAMLWSVSLPQILTLNGLLEYPGTDLYIIYGSRAPSFFDEDALLLYAQRASGVVTPGLGTVQSLSAGVDQYTAMAFDADFNLVAAGRFSTDADFFAGRHAVARGLGTSLEFVALSPASSGDSALVVGRDLAVDGEMVVSTYSGLARLDVPFGFYLQKNSGNSMQLEWTRSYTLDGYSIPVAEEVVSVADGYVMLGTERDSAGQTFIVKTNKDGLPVWAKRLAYGSSSDLSEFAQNQLVALGDTLYFAANAQGAANGEAVLVKMPIDGNTGDCPYIVDVVIQGEPYNANQFYVQPPVDFAGSDTTQLASAPTDVALQNDVLCALAADPCDVLPDLTVSIDSVTCNGGVASLHYTLCNDGGGAAPDTVLVGIYLGNPVTDSVQRVAFYYVTTTGDSCQHGVLGSITNNFPAVPGQPLSLVALVNDPGTYFFGPIPVDTLALYSAAECDFTNNTDSFTVTLPTTPVLDLGADTTLCFVGEQLLLDAGAGYFSYLWQDSTTTQTFLAPAAGGTFYVRVTDECGYVQSDTIVVNPGTLATPVLDDAAVCPGASATYSATGFDAYLWTGPAGTVSCDTCDTVTLTPTETTEFTLTASTAAGCVFTGSFTVTVLPVATSTLTLTACDGDTIVFNGSAYSQNTTLTDTLTGANGCDSLAITELIFNLLPTETLSFSACTGDTITIGGVAYSTDTTFVLTVPAANPADCDTIVTYAVTFTPQPTLNETLTACAGSEIELGGVVYTADTTVTTTIAVPGGGCDTLATYVLVFTPLPETADTVSGCAGTPIVLENVEYTSDTTLVLTIAGSGGACDTLATYVLVFSPTPTTTDSLTACAGSEIEVGGVTYTADTTVVVTIPATTGCDTVATYVLTFTPLPTASETLTACAGSAIVIDSVSYTTDTTLVTTISSGGTGCDTVLTRVLEFTPLPTLDIVIELAAGDTFTIGGIGYTAPATVIDTLASTTGGCDTIATYNLVLPVNALSLECPASIVAVASGDSAVVSYGLPVVTSTTCANDSTFTIVVASGPASGGAFPVGTTEVCYLVTNECGDSATCCFNVTVLPDTTVAPLTLQCPPNVTATATSDSTAVTYALPTATTTCADSTVTFTVTDGPASGGNFPVGTTLVCFQATTSCGDTAFCCIEVTVVQPPITLQCPGNITVLTNTGSAVVTFADPVASTTCLPDNTVTFAVTDGLASGSDFPLGNTLTCFRATNECGDTSFCCLNITVVADTTPVPTFLALTCPGNISVNATGASTIVNFNQPVADTDCAAGGVVITQTAGPASGSGFPDGSTPVCFLAVNACNDSATCCFNVNVTPVNEVACESETSGCMKFEILSITPTASNDKVYRVRVTNTCSSPVRFLYFQVPSGTVAINPANNSVYTAVSGNQYLVRNPNFSPFYSIRFRPQGAPGIANGQSDILEFTLDEVTQPNVLLFAARLENGTYAEAHMFTTDCQPSQLVANTSGAEQATISTPAVEGNYADDDDAVLPGTTSKLPTTFGLFPNPTTGVLQLDLSAWTGQTVTLQVFNALGARVEQTTVAAGSRAHQLVLNGDLPGGMYHVVVQPAAGEPAVARFVLQRL